MSNTVHEQLMNEGGQLRELAENLVRLHRELQEFLDDPDGSGTDYHRKLEEVVEVLGGWLAS